MQLGVLEYLISVNSSKLKKGLQDSDKAVKESGNNMSSWLVAKGQAIERLAEKGAAAITRLAKTALTETMDFDKNMSQVAATLGYSVAELNDQTSKASKTMKQLNDFARKMGAETAFTAGEASQALNYMALAGYDAETSMRMLPQVLNLAAAGNFELARASDMVTDAQSALGLTIEETETMVDQMAKTASKTNTSVEQLGDAFLTVGGTAKKLKGGTAELSALLGVLANNGIKGSEGGTALRNVLNALSNPVGKAAKQLKTLGVAAYDADGNLRSMPEILMDFNKAMEGKSMKERTEIFAKMFNVRDLKSVEALLSMTADDWAKLTGEITDSKGAAAQMAEVQLDNLAGDVTKLKSALGEAKLTLVEGLTPALRKFVQTGTKLIQRFTEAFKRSGFKGVFEEIKKVFTATKMTIADRLGLDPNNASWGKLFVEILKKAGKALKGKALKLLFGSSFTGDASISDIGKKIWEKLKSGFSKAKITIASFLGVEDAENASWGDIGKKVKEKIEGYFATAKIGIAKLFGLGEDASWSSIISAIPGKIAQLAGALADTAKVSIAKWLGITTDDEVTWQAIVDNIATKIGSLTASAKASIAKWLGVTADDEATWGDIANAAKEKLKNLLTNAKIGIARMLRVEDAQNATWSTIAGTIGQRIKAAFNKAKIGLANLLGVDDPTWTNIGTELANRIKDGFSSVKLSIASWLGITDAAGNPIEDIGWLDIGGALSKKLSTWLDEGLAEGGWADRFITNFGEKWAAIFEIAGTIFESIANYLNDTGNQTKIAEIIVNILQTVINSATTIIPKIVELLTTVFTNQTFLDGLMSLTQALCNLLVAVITNQDVWNAVVVLLDSVIRSVFGEDFTSGILGKKKKLAWEEYTDSEGNTKRRSKIVEDTEHTPEEGLLPRIVKNVIEDKTGIDMSEGSTGGKVFDYGMSVTGNMVPVAAGFGMSGLGGVKIVKKAMSESGGGALQKLGETLAGSGAAASDELVEGAEEAGGMFKQEIVDGVTYLVNTVSGLKIPIEGAPILDPFSNAKGNWSVPYDNYPALLHRGELVMNKSQARQYRDGYEGESGVSADALAQAVEAAMSRVYVMMSGEKVGDLTTRRIKKNLNASSYARMRALGG